jgi:hypothetical protein
VPERLVVAGLPAILSRQSAKRDGGSAGREGGFFEILGMIYLRQGYGGQVRDPPSLKLWRTGA